MVIYVRPRAKPLNLSPYIISVESSVGISLKDRFDKFFATAYMAEINKVVGRYPRKRSLEIDWKKLEAFDRDLADVVLDNPDAAIKAASEAIEELAPKTLTGEPFKPNIRFINIPDKGLLIEDLGVRHINKLIMFKGLVTRRGTPGSRATVAAYRCTSCGMEFKYDVGRDFKPPSKCPVCKKGFLVEDVERMEFVDTQVAEVQEILERVQPGTDAAKTIITLEDDLVNQVIPGENVEIIGILRLNKDVRKGKSKPLQFQKYVEVNNIKRLKKEFEEIEISPEDERRILELAEQLDIVDKIKESIAPDIKGYEEVKLALALQLFGGTKGKISKGGMPLRDDIHILLVGDPGIAKTRFLQSVSKIAPKSIYVSGKTVSGVGLTAAVEKDELSGTGWTLKAGALVLASGGIAAIDEFDKINPEDRSALHDVMEIGTVNIAKAGIVGTFRAKTAIVAAANPKMGRFIQGKNIPLQFNIPPSLMSRFDLIFPLMDVLNAENDERLAEHILNIHATANIYKKDVFMQDSNIEEKRVIPKELLRKYIAYAKSHVYPKLSEEAMALIKEFYVNLRKQGAEQEVVSITPRYLDGLVRLSEAHAKMRLSNVVEKIDAERAIFLMDYVMKQTITSEEGSLDVDIWVTGHSSKERKERLSLTDQVVEIIRELSNELEDVTEEAVLKRASEYGLNEHKVIEVINEMLRDGLLYSPKPGTVAFPEG